MTAASMDLGPVYTAAGREWNVDPALLQAVAGQESGGTANPDQARSTAGAQGRMQLMPGTAQDMGVTDTSDPVQNIYGGAKYLSQMLDRYQSTADPVSAALAAYNAGPGRVDAYLSGQGALPAETVAYVPGVASRYRGLTSSQQPSPGQSPATAAAPSVDDVATAGLNTAMARLQGGGAQSAPTPAATPMQSASSQATPGGGVDYFSKAAAAARALTGGNPAPSAPAAAQPVSTATQAPVGGQPGATATSGPVDYFSMAKTAAAAAAGAPPSTGGTATPVSVPGATQPSPSTAPPGGGSVMGAIGNVGQAVGQQAENFAEGAGHAVLGASRALYGAINAGNQAVPVPGQTLGGLIDPSKAIPNLDAENAQYQQSGVGNTPAGIAGNLVGQTALTLPVLGGLGTAASVAGRGIAAGADAISPALGTGTRGIGNLLTGTASTPGNALTNAIVRPASLAANGAAQGAVAGAVSGDPNSSIGQNMLTGAGAGALLGPAAAAVGAGASGTWNALTGTFAPFYQSGRDAIADTVLAKAAQGGPLVPNTTAYVPGSTPTLAQATGNPGLAGVERAVASVRPQQFTAQATANNDARAGLVNSLTGTPTDIETAQAARDATAVPAITGPLASAIAPANAAPVVSTIDQILASPAGQRDAVTSALGNIRSKLVTPIPFGDRVGAALGAVNDAIAANPGGIDAGLIEARNTLIAAQNGGQQASTLARLQGTTSSDPAAQAVIDQAGSTIGTANRVESDPSQLYGIRKAIGDSLSPLAARSGSDAQLASSELMQVKTALDNSIEGAAPGFKKGLADYADSSSPINAMSYLQSKGYTSADGTVTLAKVKGVLDDISKQQALPGARDAKSVPQATVDSLQGLYADLLRQNNSRLGMQPGSNTFQNLATSNTLANYGAPLTIAANALSAVPGARFVTGGLSRLYGGQNEPIMDAVVNKLMNPEAGASVLKKAGKLQAQAAAGPSGANPFVVVPGTNLLTSAGQR